MLRTYGIKDIMALCFITYIPTNKLNIIHKITNKDVVITETKVEIFNELNAVFIFVGHNLKLST